MPREHVAGDSGRKQPIFHGSFKPLSEKRPRASNRQIGKRIPRQLRIGMESAGVEEGVPVGGLLPWRPWVLGSPYLWHSAYWLV